jgi:hypothetical protein
MKSSWRVVLCLLSLSALSAVPALALERPACGQQPGACFLNLEDLGQITFALTDADGDLLIAQIPTSADDFLQVRPNGTISGHIHNVQSQIFVCPVTALPGCLDDDIGNPGLLAGSGRLLIDATLTPQFEAGCPSAATAAGTLVQSETGALFKMTFIFVAHPAGQGCTMVMNDIQVTPKTGVLLQRSDSGLP